MRSAEIGKDITVLYAHLGGLHPGMTRVAAALAGIMSDNGAGEVTRRLFELVGARDLDAVAALFADRVEFAIPGAPDLPWLPTTGTPAGMRGFFAGLPEHLESKRFEIAKIIADADDAVALGDLVSVVRATGRTIATQFVIHVGVRDGKINRYVMYEDSWAVARALGR